MSVIMDVDVNLYCDLCGNEIHNEEDVVCRGCYDSSIKETVEEVRETLETILPYVNEATVLRPVEIPGEVAFKLREKIRLITGS